MKIFLLPTIVIGVVFAAAAVAQDAGSAPPAGQNAGPGAGGGYGQRGGRGFGGMGGGMGMVGRGVFGTVSAIAADHYTIKTAVGDSYIVNFSANTRMMKQPAGMRGSGGGPSREMGENSGTRRGGYGARTPPEEIKATDIKVGDVIAAMGEVDAAAKSIGAVRIMLLDPETAKRIEEMEANFGKTWLQGKVTAIDGTKITLTGTLDNAVHPVLADENTTFRKRRDPVTMADIQVGDMVRVEGAVKDGAFTATSVDVDGMMGGERQGGPRNPAPQQ